MEKSIRGIEPNKQSIKPEETRKVLINEYRESFEKETLEDTVSKLLRDNYVACRYLEDK